ncbi:MAG: hypothetical protein ACOCVG_05010, partial [Verrucomicrobiota bacterium]
MAAYPPREDPEAEQSEAAEADEEAPKVPKIRVGTGFFISNDGLLLVNASRALGANRVWIIHRGLEYAATAIGHDPANNLSLLRAVDLPPDFDFISMEASPSAPRIGTQLMGIAS